MKVADRGGISIYVTVINEIETRKLRICIPDEKPIDIELSNYEALQLGADLIKTVPYGVVKRDSNINT